MQSEFETSYNRIRSGDTGYFEQKRGLISVHGKEAVQFLDGLVSNDMKTLEDGARMRAAFPNAQGRLLAAVRVLRQGDKFLFETEEATREKVFNNLFRFTFAGDFFVEDLSENFRFFSVFGRDFLPATQTLIEFDFQAGSDYFVHADDAEDFKTELQNIDAVEIGDELYETLRIEGGIPLYGVDMDETTIVPELGIDDQISYNKGCYIGQEIIARIHFRGHVAKRLTGIAGTRTSLSAAAADVQRSADSEVRVPPELTSAEGKNAGRITSVTYSPKLDRDIALAYVRYDYLGEGTELKMGDTAIIVKNLPFL